MKEGAMNYYALWMSHKKTMISQFLPHGIKKDVLIREKLPLSVYFNHITNLISLPAKIVIFGAGSTKYDFRLHCAHHEAAIGASIVDIVSLDGFTNWNRLINKSRPYFCSHLPMHYVPEGLVMEDPYSLENYNH
jgi:hypothetical protein